MYTIDTCAYLALDCKTVPHFVVPIIGYLNTFYRPSTVDVGVLTEALIDKIDAHMGILFHGPQKIELEFGVLELLLGDGQYPPLLRGEQGYFGPIREILMGTLGTSDLADPIVRMVGDLMTEQRFGGTLLKAVMEKLPLVVCQMPGCQRPYFWKGRSILVNVEADSPYHSLIDVEHVDGPTWVFYVGGFRFDFKIEDPKVNYFGYIERSLCMFKVPGRHVPLPPTMDACFDCVNRMDCQRINKVDP